MNSSSATLKSDFSPSNSLKYHMRTPARACTHTQTGTHTILPELWSRSHNLKSMQGSQSAEDTDVVRGYALSWSILGKINCSTFIIQHYFLILELLAPYVRKGFLTKQIKAIKPFLMDTIHKSCQEQLASSISLGKRKPFPRLFQKLGCGKEK